MDGAMIWFRMCKVQMVKVLVLACVVCLSLSTQEHGLCSRVMFQESLINGNENESVCQKID